MRVRVTPNAKNKRALSILAEAEARSAAAQDRMAYHAAMEVYLELMRRIPSGKAYDAYRDALRVAQVERGVYAVYAEPIRKEITGVDATSAALYVQPRRRRGQIDPVAGVLAQYSPWTWDTLPVVPKRADAKIISRKVRPSEVDAIRKDRKQDERTWKAVLKQLGVRVRKGSARVISSTQDLGFDIERIEKGMSSGSLPPHWRPSIRHVLQSKLRSFPTAHPDIVRTLIDPKYKGWKRSPGDALPTISRTKAKSFVPFQKALGY